MSFDADVLMVCNMKVAPFDGQTTRTVGIGGSELEVVQIAEALAKRGHKVVCATGTEDDVQIEGVRYVPYEWLVSKPYRRVRAVYAERWTAFPEVHADKYVVRATDVCCPPYDVHNGALGRGFADLVCVSKWQAKGFVFAKRKHVIPPMYDDLPAQDKVRHQFIYASAPTKGLEPTRLMWHELRRLEPKLMADATLAVVLPGRSFAEMPTLSDADVDAGIYMVGVPTIDEYRKEIARSEGLFYVANFVETYGGVAAMAEIYGGRAHVLCLHGKAGLAEAVAGPFVTTSRDQFASDFFRCLKTAPPPVTPEDRSPSALAPAWERVLEIA